MRIDSILNRSVEKDVLDIIVMGATHERYESLLCKTGHNFYSLKMGKEWDSSYGIKPKNYYELSSLPFHINYDLIICHTSCDRLESALLLGQELNVPVIRHCHVLPSCTNEIVYFNSFQPTITTFISEYSKKVWSDKYIGVSSKVINHGVDCSFWNSEGREKDKVINRCMSAVNLWEQRDWACGWNIWTQTVTSGNLPYFVAGNNPGLSEALQPNELKKEYQRSRLFLNTSLNSPIPMALLEAMACGCPVVTLDTCMIPEFVEHEKTGFLCKNIKDLIYYCNILLNDPDLSEEMGQAAEKLIRENYNEKIFTDNWNNLFKEVLR